MTKVSSASQEQVAEAAAALSKRRANLQKHEHFRSEFLKNERTLVVYLPPGYDARPDLRYPVLYLQDGQNLFDPKTAYAGNEWKADETADELVAARQIEPLIIVGIYNTGEHRIEEYTT